MNDDQPKPGTFTWWLYLITGMAIVGGIVAAIVLGIIGWLF